MYSIIPTETGANIKLTKGDSFYCQIGIKQDGDSHSDGNIDDNYILQEGDVVRFSMKKTYSDRRILIDKIIPNDTLILHLAPEDTKRLDIGAYVYDVELTFANGDIDTFIQGKIILTPEAN